MRVSPSQARPESRRGLVLRGLVALVATLAAIPLAGDTAAQSPPKQTTLSVRVSSTLASSSCADEAVSVRGWLHLVLHTLSPARGGGTDVRVDLKQLEGVGQTSGASYRFDNARRERVRLPCAPGSACPDISGDFTLQGSGLDDELRGRLVVRLQTTPHGSVNGQLFDARFVCAQE